MDDREVYQFILGTLSELSRIPADQIKPESRLQEDLDLDSLQAIEVLHRVEKKYLKKFTEVDIEQLQTPAELWEFCKRFLHE
jgi:acyl carrier protein